MEDMQNKSETTVIMPVFNEAGAVADVLRELTASSRDIGFQVIVVDDGSTDGSAAVVDGFKDQVQVIHHASNHGYGAALKTGILATRAQNVVFFDSDGQHKTENMAELIGLLAEHEFVFGERPKGGGSPLIRQPGKWVLGKVCNFLALRKIPDINCGFRGGRRRIYMRMLDLLPDGFSFSTTSLLFALRSRYSTAFMPVQVEARQGKSSVRIFYDGFKTLLLALRLMMLFDPMRAFGYPAMGLILVGVIYQIYIFCTAGLHIEGGAILSLLAGVILFHFGLLGDQVASLRKEMSSQTSLFWEEHEFLERRQSQLENQQ
jgi:glycosyltransferase involved in cell wall biosynthesis